MVEYKVLKPSEYSDARKNAILELELLEQSDIRQWTKKKISQYH